MAQRRLHSAFIPLCLLLCLLAGAAVPVAGAQQAAAGLPAPTIALSTSTTGNFFAPGQPVTVAVKLTNPARSSRTLILTEASQDVTGTTTVLFTGTVTLPGVTPQYSEVTLPVHSLGYFELDVTLTDPSNGQPLATKQISIGVMNLQPLVPNATSPFGVAGNLTQAYNGDVRKLATAAAEIAAAGIQYVREEINWQAVQQKPGVGSFNFGAVDPAVVAAHNAGLKVLGLLAYWSSLPQPDTTIVLSGTEQLNKITGCSKGPVCAYTPQADALFAQYAAAVVNHYKPGGELARQQGWTDGYGITDWEVWNEPSNQTFWRRDLKDSPQLFAALYSTTSAAIHQTDAGAQVMYDESGTVFDNAIAAAHGGHEILAIHSYTGGLDPDTSLAQPTLPRGGQGTAPAAISSFVAQGKPVWITETGYATDGTVTNRQQADFLVREFVNFLAAHVTKEFWFKFREDAPGGDNLYGLVHQDFSPKPSYLAYATMAHQLTGTTFAQQVQLGSAVRAFLFSGAQGTSAVLYSVGEPGTVTMPLSGTRSVVTDMMGNSLPITDSTSLHLPIDQDPLYVTFPGVQPAQVATALLGAQISGINPVGVAVQLSPGLVNGLPNARVTVTARTNVPISGTTTLQLPDGWTATALVQPFPLLQPGQSTTQSFRLLSEVSHPGDVLTATATLVNGFASVGTGAVQTYALTYGHPQIDGTLATWGTASELDLINLQQDQIVGIPGWTPQNISARIYTMWDEKYFYLATAVHDMTFDYAPVGYNMYQGDSIQYGWGMDPLAWTLDSGTQRYNVTAGLTHQGPANFQYNILGPWPDMLVQIKPDPASGDLIYTTAVPWSRLGGYTPTAGKQFAFNLLINQNEHHSRIGWIQITPGMGIGFYPSQFQLWSIIPSNPAAGIRLSAGQPRTLTFSLPAAHGSVVIHDGGMRQILLSINGGMPITLTARKDYAAFSATSVDLSKYLHTGSNSVVISGVPANPYGAAVLSFFQ